METLSLFDSLTEQLPPQSATLPQAAKNIMVFDVETQKSFKEVGGRNHLYKLRVAAAVCYHAADQSYRHYTENTVIEMIGELQKADLVVGFNVLGFDYGVLQPYAGIVPLSKLPTLDLMDDIYKKLGVRIGLNKLAQWNLGAKKSADGLQSIAWFKQGRIDEILKYCEQDVRVTKDLFELGRAQGYVVYENPNTFELQKLEVCW
jgi:DEAD/DEAH box helicase domain-containing protein